MTVRRHTRTVVHFSRPKKASGLIFLIRAYIFTFLLVKSQKCLAIYNQYKMKLCYIICKKNKAKLIGKSHNNVNSIRSSCHVNYIHTVVSSRTLWRIIVLVMPFCNDFWRPQFADGTRNVDEIWPMKKKSVAMFFLAIAKLKRYIFSSL